MSDKPTIDAEFRVVEPRYEWRIRFWPSVLFWLYVTGVVGAAQQMMPREDPAVVAVIVLMAALVSPFVRIILAMFSALTGGALVDDSLAQQERNRRLTRGGSRRGP